MADVDNEIDCDGASQRASPKLEVAPGALRLPVGLSSTLKATLKATARTEPAQPELAAPQIGWRSRDAWIASVGYGGKLCAHSHGETRIVATWSFGEETATAEVRVVVEPHGTLPDEWLMYAHAHGDELAFDHLFRRNYPKIRLWLSRLWFSIDANTADDLAQEVWIKVYKTRNYAPSGALDPWLRTIACNAKIDYLRKRRLPLADDSLVNQKPSSAPDPAAQEATDVVVGRLLDRLDDETRAIFVLHMQGMTFEQIARNRGVPTNTLKSQYWRALQELKKIAGRERERVS